MPEPTNTPSAPSCIIIAASAGVAMPPAVNSTTGSLPAFATSATSSYGAWSSFAAVNSSSAGRPASRRMLVAQRRMCRVASTTLPVPASPLDLIIAAPSAIRRSASPRLVAPQTNGTVNFHLSTWCASSAGRQHLGLVDVVDADRLQHLGLGEVADPALGHHRDRHGADDAVDHVRVAHPGDAALRADVGGHPLERHHGDRAGVLGDLGLLGRHHVHDHAALEHLRHAALDARGAGLFLRGNDVFAGHCQNLLVRACLGPSYASRQEPDRAQPGPSPSGSASSISKNSGRGALPASRKTRASGRRLA